MLEVKMTELNQKLLQPNDIGDMDIMSGNGDTQELNRCREYLTLCSHESIVVSMVVLAVGAVNIFIIVTFYDGWYSHTGYYKHIEYWWVLWALGILSWLLALSFIIRTCMANQQNHNKEMEEEIVKDRKEISIIAAVGATLKTNFNHTFDVNGKYFLVTMYANELFEHILQVYSLNTVYLCTVPVALSTTVCAVMTVELLINIWATFHIDSHGVRDGLIFLDILTDLFCMAFPSLYFRWSAGVRIPVNKMILVVVLPTLSLYLKLNDIWEIYFEMDLERIQETKNQQNATRYRRRKSILNLSHNRDVLNMQLEHFPKWLRYVFTVLNICFVLFFVSLASLHLATQPSNDKCSDIFTKEVWEGCKVPVPFCQELFVAKCDCAVMKMTNYTQKALPESFGKLTSLVKLNVYSGQLEELPKRIGDNHGKLLHLWVLNNQLKSLPDSVGKLQELRSLWVFNNQLKSLPDSVGKLQNLFQLRVFNNQLKSLPDSVGKLQKNLLYLWVFNNELTSLPDSVGKLQNLLFLYASNNQLKSLPDSVGKLQKLRRLWVFNNQLKSLPDSVGKLQTLLHLYAWNNTFTALPKTVGDMKSLTAVDVRYNGLTNLPSSVSQWSKVEYLYLAGNPMCANLDTPSNLKDAKGLCEQQCSVDCPSSLLTESALDRRCFDNSYTYYYTSQSSKPGAGLKPKPNSGCNTAVCEYNIGVCPR